MTCDYQEAIQTEETIWNIQSWFCVNWWPGTIMCMDISRHTDDQIWVLYLGTATGGLTWWRHQMETFSALLAIYVNSPHKGQWRGALMFSLIYVWINGWENNREAGDLRCYHAHYDIIVMKIIWWNNEQGMISESWITPFLVTYSNWIRIYQQKSFIKLQLE